MSAAAVAFDVLKKLKYVCCAAPLPSAALMAVEFHALMPLYRKASSSEPTHALGVVQVSLPVSVAKLVPEVGERLRVMSCVVAAFAGER